MKHLHDILSLSTSFTNGWNAPCAQEVIEYRKDNDGSDSMVRVS